MAGAGAAVSTPACLSILRTPEGDNAGPCAGITHGPAEALALGTRVDEKAPAGPEQHGRCLHAHPLFLDQLERLLAAVERAKRSDPQGWQGKADTRLLAALRALILDRIPRDTLAAEFRQSNTLGRERRH